MNINHIIKQVIENHAQDPCVVVTNSVTARWVDLHLPFWDKRKFLPSVLHVFGAAECDYRRTVPMAKSLPLHLTLRQGSCAIVNTGKPQNEGPRFKLSLHYFIVLIFDNKS
jgi:hypothetical protein